MWALYADENKGCCIELEVTAKGWEKHDVKYRTQMPSYQDSIIDILTTKSVDWSHQQEVRFLKKKEKGTSHYLSIKIHQIIFGLRVDKTKFLKYKRLINRLDPKIEVVKMKWRNAHLGYE